MHRGDGWGDAWEGCGGVGQRGCGEAHVQNTDAGAVFCGVPWVVLSRVFVLEGVVFELKKEFSPPRTC